MPIGELASSRLKYAELGSYVRDLCTILYKCSFTEPVIVTLTKELDDSVVALEDRSGLKLKNPVTGQLKLAIGARKKSYLEMRDHVKGCLDSLDEKKKVKAQVLYPIFEQHNTNLIYLGQPEVSHHLNALLTDLKKEEYKEARAELVIDDKIAEVEAAQKNIETLNVKLLEAKKETSLPSILEYVVPIRKSLEKIIAHLNIMEQMDKDTYKPAVDEINELISLISSKLQARKTRADNAASKPKLTGTGKKKTKKSKPSDTEASSKADTKSEPASASPEAKKEPGSAKQPETGKEADTAKKSDTVKAADKPESAETESLEDSELEQAMN